MTLENLSYPLVIGHRGFRTEYPENTMIAFAAAVDTGVRMIEMDVTLSRDRQPVVIHDDRLNRTTNGKGLVRRYNLAELKKLDAGSWLNARFAGERIPVLDEVLQRFGRLAAINIEIKPSAFETPEMPDSIERQIVDLVMREALAERILISSFEPGCLERLHRMQPSLPLAVLTDHTPFEPTLVQCRRLGVFSWHPDHRELSPDKIERMHAAGLRVMPYTVNSRSEIMRVLDMGVDGFFTDDPPLAFEVIDKRRH